MTLPRAWPAITKSFTESTHRSRTPDETLAAFEPLTIRLGITRLADITGLDRIGVPVVVAIRPMSRGLATAQGKGLDLATARASALMEAIETWHAERLETVARFDPIGQIENAIDVQYLHRQPGRDPALAGPIGWVLADEFFSGSPIWVPWDAVSCDFSTTTAHRRTFPPTTNGLGSGNHMIEATLHGLCELIERDAITLHQYLPKPVQAERQIDLQTVTDPRCVQLLERLHAAEVNVSVWDCTSDIEVPTMSALITDSPRAELIHIHGPFRGHGCHPNREIALLRALTEAIQSRLTYISGSRDDLFPEDYRALERMAHTAAAAAERTGARSFDEVTTVDNPTFNADLDHVLDNLLQVGIEQVAVVDLSRADVGVPVVKVIAPRLENNLHNHPNYLPGPRARHDRI